MKVSEFDFELPNELIATHPLSQRDASRMLVVNVSPSCPPHAIFDCAVAPGRGAVAGSSAFGETTLPLKEGGTTDRPNFTDAHVSDFISYLQPGDVVVFNNSRVIPARFDAVAADGTVYELTLHTNVSEKVWLGFAKKFQKLKIGEKLELNDGTQIEVIDKSDEDGLKIKFILSDESKSQIPGTIGAENFPPLQGCASGTIFEVLERVGKMPLPPYMKRDEEQADRERYQTVYASPPGSMAAPTAGLHFTPELLGAIKDAGAEIVNITLHVGAGTWMPVKSEDTNAHKMHSEWGEITPEQAEIINNARTAGGRVIAIGTTSLRLLESAVNKSAISNQQSAIIMPFRATTDIFITPGYEFKVVDVLLTNFHLPKSTLLMLVSAFAGTDEIRTAYTHAIAEKYRFFSYGDCCLFFKKI